MLRLPEAAVHPNFSLLVLLTQEEVVWRDDGRGSWRRKGWSVADRRLLHVVDQRLFNQPTDYLALIPAELPLPFTNQELVGGRQVAQRLVVETVAGPGEAGRDTVALIDQ